MSADPISVLAAIVAEVAGHGQPFSADSYLPPHLIHDAREAIAKQSQEVGPVEFGDTHEAYFIRRIIDGEKTLAEKNREIELCHLEIDRQEKRIESLQAMNAGLDTPYTRPVANDDSHAGCEAHAQFLLARLRKADETIVALRSEIDRLRESVNERVRRIAELQREVESEREACRKSGKRISALHDANAELEKSLESANSENRAICRRCDGLVKLNDELSSALSKRIPGFPPETLPDTSHLIFDPFQRLTAYGRRQECDE